MNFVIILTVCAVLIVGCNHSWQQVALAADLEIQRAISLQNFYRCEGLLNYGKILFQQAQLNQKNKRKLNLVKPKDLQNVVLLYSGPWPLPNSGDQKTKIKNMHSQLEAKFNLAKKSWHLYSTLLNSEQHLQCQISCEIVDINQSQIKFTNWQQKI